jgi:hypothetical protein
MDGLGNVNIIEKVQINVSFIFLNLRNQHLHIWKMVNIEFF